MRPLGFWGEWSIERLDGEYWLGTLSGVEAAASKEKELLAKIKCASCDNAADQGRA